MAKGVGKVVVAILSTVQTVQLGDHLGFGKETTKQLFDEIDDETGALDAAPTGRVDEVPPVPTQK